MDQYCSAFIRRYKLLAYTCIYTILACQRSDQLKKDMHRLAAAALSTQVWRSQRDLASSAERTKHLAGTSPAWQMEAAVEAQKGS